MIRLLSICLLPLALMANITPEWTAMSRAERVKALNNIADSCQLPHSFFALRGEDELRVQPSPHAPYQRIDCALHKLKDLRGFDNLGFVGNEQYKPEKPHP